jgi:hypothetical protein
MPITYSPRQVRYGFDNSAAPKWQMVPVGGSRVLNVSGHAGLVPRVRDTRIATVAMTNSGNTARITIRGLRAGKTHIEWVTAQGDAGPVTVANTLELSVKAKRSIRTTFHYVQDNAGHKTTRRIADIDAIVQGCNDILTPQANVELVKKTAKETQVNANLGTSVRFSSHIQGVAAAEHEWDDVTALRDNAADFNVFFVWEYEQDNTPNRHDANAGTLASEMNCIFDDHSIGPSQTLAHETVHALGVAGHVNHASHLMLSTYSAAALMIPKAHANVINTSGT